MQSIKSKTKKVEIMPTKKIRKFTKEEFIKEGDAVVIQQIGRVVASVTIITGYSTKEKKLYGKPGPHGLKIPYLISEITSVQTFTKAGLRKWITEDMLAIAVKESNLSIAKNSRLDFLLYYC